MQLQNYFCVWNIGHRIHLFLLFVLLVVFFHSLACPVEQSYFLSPLFPANYRSRSVFEVVLLFLFILFMKPFSAL